MKSFLKISESILMFSLRTVFFLTGLCCIFIGLNYFLFINPKETFIAFLISFPDKYFYILIISFIVSGFVTIYEQTSRYVDYTIRRRQRSPEQAAINYCKSIQNQEKKNIDHEIIIAFMKGYQYKKEE